MRYGKAYQALIDMLQLNCDCPIFGCLKYYKKNANGRVSSSVKLTLNVPDEHVRLTEYATWADFMYYVRFTKHSNYKRLEPDCTEITQHKFNRIMYSLKTQRPPSEYRVPQVVLEEIRPEWLVKEQDNYLRNIGGKINHLLKVRIKRSGQQK